MNVSLTQELEKFVQGKVKSGLYNNQSEVVREALRLMIERDSVKEAHLERLRTALSEGLEQADRGELLGGDDVIREMKALLSARHHLAPRR